MPRGCADGCERFSDPLSLPGEVRVQSLLMLYGRWGLGALAATAMALAKCGI